VVGGGTAGLTLASRLSETASVAVIEAGGFYETDNGNMSVVPFNSLLMGVLTSAAGYARQPLVDWDLITVPQAAYNNSRLHYAQGKTLGGSSALNTMGYHRGSKGAYQRWADLVDDQSYTFDNLLPYFQKSCNFTPPDLEKRNAPNAIPAYDPGAFSATGGPLHVSYVNWVDPTVVALSGALQQIGLSISPTGFNSGIMSGYRGFATSTINPTDATRSSSYSSFLKQALVQTEIMVYPHTQAMKILFDNSKKATGVVVSTQGLEYTISARKEVIVSTGVFHSPQLLMVSGRS
jgi:choline dehydrogenase